MNRYSVQSRNIIFVKGDRFLFFFAKNMGKNIDKNISKNLNGKHSQKLLNHAKQSATDPLKTTSNRAIQKAEATGDLTGNKIFDKITKVSKTSQQNNSKQLQMNTIKE